jgi:hypothetical protein
VRGIPILTRSPLRPNGLLEAGPPVLECLATAAIKSIDEILAAAGQASFVIRFKTESRDRFSEIA